jgi:hypothetical protein
VTHPVLASVLPVVGASRDVAIDLDRLAEHELTRRINELRPPKLQVIVPQVDARLWVPFHRTHWPHHLTRTIFY